MKRTPLDTLAWTLIFAGLVVVAVGVVLQRQADAGMAAAIAGAVAIAAGVVLIGVRARRTPPSELKEKR